MLSAFFFRGFRLATVVRTACRWLLVLLGLALLAGCDKPRMPLVVGANPWPGYEGLFLARDQGLVSENQVHVLDFPSTSEVLRAFRNGTLDAAALTLDEALSLVNSGEAIKVVLVFDISAGADALIARPEVASLAALRGRRIGIELNTTSSLLLARALDKAGLSANEVTLVRLSLDAQQQALQQGEVDALATCEPLRSQLAASGALVLFDSSAMPNEIVDVLVVRQSLLESRADDLAALVSAWGLAQQRVLQGEAALIDQAAHRSGMTPAQFRAALAGMSLPDLAQNRDLLAPGGPLAAQAGRLATFMQARGWLNPLSTSNLVDDRLVRSALLPPAPGRGGASGGKP
jgi:NitT/TauT family transport system substrate-binding protein